MEQSQYGKGSFLIANPVLPDPNFSRTVVLLCNHNEEGSFGLVVNRKAELKTQDLFPKNDILQGYEGELFVGGPVSQSQVFYLCRHPESIPDLDEICPGVHLGMSWEVLEEVYNLLENPLDNLRFYLGYSGWGAGQLDGEMEQRSWLIREAEDNFVFSPQENQLWHDVVRSMGKDYAYLLNAPVDPRWN